MSKPHQPFTRRAEHAIGLDPLANRNFTISGSTSRSFGYDAAGNLASDARPDDNRTFGYDSFNRLGGFYFNGALTDDYRSTALKQRVTTLRRDHRNAAVKRACQPAREFVAGVPAPRALRAGGAPARG